MLNKQILRLAVPNIITNITIPLLSSIDIGLMGHSGVVLNIGAVSVGNMIFSMLFWMFSFLRMGTSGFTAQAYGNRDLKETANISVRAFIIALGLGLMLILLQTPIEYLAFRVLSGSDAVETLAKEYFRIRIYSAPATLIMYVALGWYIGMQNARFPMFISISINILNIFLSFYFVRHLDLGSNGIAWANLISQWIGCVFSLLLFTKYWKHIGKHLDLKLIFDAKSWKHFLYVNKDIFIRTLCLIAVLSFFTAESAKLGDITLAVNTLLFQFFYMFSYFIDGFGYAAEAIVGKFIGNKNKVMVNKSVKLLFKWGIFMTAFFVILYATLYNPILKLLSTEATVLEQSKEYIIWIIIIPITSYAAFIWDGIFIGATASKPMRQSMLIVTILIFFPLYYILKPYMSNHALWLAFNVFMISRGLFLKYFSKRIFDV